MSSITVICGAHCRLSLVSHDGLDIDGPPAVHPERRPSGMSIGRDTVTATARLRSARLLLVLVLVLLLFLLAAIVVIVAIVGSASSIAASASCSAASRSAASRASLLALRGGDPPRHRKSDAATASPVRSRAIGRAVPASPRGPARRRTRFALRSGLAARTAIPGLPCGPARRACPAGRACRRDRACRAAFRPGPAGMALRSRSPGSPARPCGPAFPCLVVLSSATCILPLNSGSF